MRYAVLLALVVSVFAYGKEQEEPVRLKRKKERMEQPNDRCPREHFRFFKAFCARPQGDVIDRYGLKCLKDWGEEVPDVASRGATGGVVCRSGEADDHLLFSAPMDICSEARLWSILEKCKEGDFLGSWQLECLSRAGVYPPKLPRPPKAEDASLPEKGFLCKLDPPEKGVRLEDRFHWSWPVDDPCDQEERYFRDMRAFSVKSSTNDPWPSPSCDRKTRVALSRAGLNGASTDRSRGSKDSSYREHAR